MRKTITVLLMWLPGMVTPVSGDELAALRKAFPGLQTTHHSGHSGGRGYGHQGITWGDGHWFLFTSRRFD